MCVSRTSDAVSLLLPSCFWSFWELMRNTAQESREPFWTLREQWLGAPR